ncbi:protein dpy-30 [Trypanosoma rangeli]|uniref:Protein dpy-30 n=1 Tax=Trypanosoma rangeli TaxID=5698 RepID=A0A3S5ISP3_TRYRA|nr:protein dpy-30 [Trypanosoma rangeli]RNF12523.1 protein dpy-30 [Trypanosoma rangeli]|eukprot:RNF12523.1 protein dpy-30 [Trypanosoma rangeli]
MSAEHSTPETFQSAVLQSPTGVLVAYADTYFGKRLFLQLHQENHSRKAGKGYKLFACTWEKDGVQALVHERDAETHRRGAESNGTAATLNNSPGDAKGSTSGMTTAQLSSSPVYDQDITPVRVFWRGDASAMRHAILQVDHIVMEMRQAQDVFDMMHVLNSKELLKRKRVIVISSLLTWYATPPIQMDFMDGKDGKNDTKNGGNFEEEEEEVEEEPEEEPQPLDQREVDAILGQFHFLGGGEEDDNNNDDNENEQELTMELLTEDQYNRRIPHAKYYNWREAERIVASGNSDEQNIQTCVVFAGLQYGEGEDVLEPFFAQVWNREKKGLPIYGDGTQIVPTVHVRDLVTFTRRLIEAEYPPALPYVFATDSGTVSWQRMVRAMNHAFGGEKTFHVPPEDYVLYDNVELFTLNMRVDNQTMRDLMPDDEDWVAQSGFVANIAKTASEYVAAHNLQPIRIVLLGKPLSGKTYLAEALAKRHYNLPTFTMERVLEEYKAYIAALKERLGTFRRRLYELEKKRREDAKKRVFLRHHTKPDDEERNEEDQAVEETGEANIGVQRENGVDNTVEADGVSDGKKRLHGAVGVNEDSDMEEHPVDFALTEEEHHAVEELVEEWFQQNDRATQLREVIASMERVLAMKVRVQPSANADAQNATNPKKKKEQAKFKRGNRSGSRKNATEDDDVSTELQENAPFQDKTLAVMMRWRLSRADCRNQGYVMDGFPETLAQARLVFGEEPLEIPETIEEAVAAFTPNSTTNFSGPGTREANVTPLTKEACNEARLPSFVFVLDASENYLLDRLTALSKALNEPPGSEEKRLARFEEAMTLYRKQFVDTDYSLPDFFECAYTVAKTLTPGGRGVTVSFLNVEAEPLLSPPPPESQYAVARPSNVEQIVCERVGKPHNFGPTPHQRYQEEVRQRNLQEEERQEELKASMEQREREKQEYIHESEERSQIENTRQEIEVMDRNSLEQRKLPLREYLQHNIVPLLSKGLVEVCKTRPKDPVDFLAEWLMRHNPLDDSCFEL